MISTRALTFFLLFFFTSTLIAQDEVPELTWPREVEAAEGVATFYQPQIDSHTANIVEGRCALSYKPNDGELEFGAFWFRAFLQTDKEARTVVLDQMDVLDVHFPGLEDEEKIAEVSKKIQDVFESMNLVMSLDRLLASLSDEQDVQHLSDEIDNNPPDVYYREESTILITIDGQPIWKDASDYKLKYAVNSAFFIAQDTKSSLYYINGGDYWYTSPSPDQPWELTSDIPKGVKSFADQNKPDSESKAEDGNTQAPKILVVTKPSELIVIQGEPDYQTIDGTSLLYVKNTENDILMDINTQMHYVLIAGRWYKSKSLEDGSWKFEDPQNLPDDFAKIPSGSDMETVLASVPETEESRDALLEQTIPQTAEVSRSEARVEVKFDGSPQFKQIPNTDVSYSENSDKSVMKIDQRFYVVDNGIWFVSNYPEGPYEVSDHRPDEVDQIPPSEPVYNTKYVYVYSSTPEYVYVGYLPGYTHSYVYNGVVVYGTGYHYPYWYGSYYYPRPVTYGFSVHYNPYSGWGFSMGFSAGWIGWGFHPYYRPYWGPCGYRAGYRHGYYNGYNHGYHQGYRRGAAAGYAAGSRNNAYANREGVRKSNYKGQVGNRQDRSRPSSKQNNMYSDKQGNVYQRDKSGNWDQKSRPSREGTNAPSRGGQTGVNKGDSPNRTPSTRPTSPSTRPTSPNTRPQTRPSTSPSRQQPTNLNRSYQNRQHGQQNYNRSRQQMQRAQPTRSAPTRSAPSRGGGGRRR